MIIVSSCGCLCPIHWSRVLSREWRCIWSSADRRCSIYIWVISKFNSDLFSCYKLRLFVRLKQKFEHRSYTKSPPPPPPPPPPGFLSPDCPDVPDSVKSLWIRNYVERKYELLGSQSSQIPEVVFEKAEIEFGLAEMVGVRNAYSNFRSRRRLENWDLGSVPVVNTCSPRALTHAGFGDSPSYEERGARRRYQGQRPVITSHSTCCYVITCPCPWFLLVA